MLPLISDRKVIVNWWLKYKKNLRKALNKFWNLFEKIVYLWFNGSESNKNLCLEFPLSRITSLLKFETKVCSTCLKFEGTFIISWMLTIKIDWNHSNLFYFFMMIQMFKYTFGVFKRILSQVFTSTQRNGLETAPQFGWVGTLYWLWQS